ncbi:hypothetical protein D9M72_625190 [compost metagenome]
MLLDGLGGRRRFHQHRHTVPVEHLANLGHREVPRRTLDQPHAQALLQPGDSPAQLRFGFTQCAAGRVETAVLHHLGEIVEVVEVFHFSVPLAEH